MRTPSHLTLDFEGKNNLSVVWLTQLTDKGGTISEVRKNFLDSSIYKKFIPKVFNSQLLIKRDKYALSHNNTRPVKYSSFASRQIKMSMVDNSTGNKATLSWILRARSATDESTFWNLKGDKSTYYKYIFYKTQTILNNKWVAKGNGGDSGLTLSLLNIHFLRKERLYTKLKYSRSPAYDIVSGGAAALLAGFIGFLISEKFGFELVDSGDFYYLFMYLVFISFSIRPLLTSLYFKESLFSVISMKFVLDFYKTITYLILIKFR